MLEAAPPFFEEEEEPEADEDESEPVSLEPEVSVAEPDFLDEEEEVVCLSSHWNLSPLISPLVFNLLKALQDNLPSVFKMKPPETLFKDSKVPLSKVPLMLTEPPMLSNLGKPEKDLNSLLSEICKAPPMVFNLGNLIQSSHHFC